MQLKKMMVSLSVLICLCMNYGMTTYADTSTSNVDDGISLAYEIATTASSHLSIIDKTAYCVSRADGIDTVSITVTQTLQKHRIWWIWDNVEDATWSEHVDDSSIYVSNSKSGLDDGTYRVESVFTLINKNGKSETITIHSNEQKI